MLHILIVEDDNSHAMLIKAAFESCQEHCHVDRVREGHEALAYLRREGQFSNRPLPDVILLDLKLPGMSGHDLLRIFKSDPEFTVIPVVILTSSVAESDRRESYRLHANSYIAKPTQFSEFRTMARSFASYWGRWNDLVPPSNQASLCAERVGFA